METLLKERLVFYDFVYQIEKQRRDYEYHEIICQWEQCFLSSRSRKGLERTSMDNRLRSCQERGSEKLGGISRRT